MKRKSILIFTIVFGILALGIRFVLPVDFPNLGTTNSILSALFVFGLILFASRKKSLLEDINTRAEWSVSYFRRMGKKLDYSVESIKEIESFLGEQTENGQPNKASKLSSKLDFIPFYLGSYIGQVFIKNSSDAVWVVDDKEPQGDTKIAVKFSDGSMVWPVQKVMKRLKNGNEDNLYHYANLVLKKYVEVSLEELKREALNRENKSI